MIYESPQLPLADPTIVRLPVGELAEGPVRVASTLYVPPPSSHPPRAPDLPTTRRPAATPASQA